MTDPNQQLFDVDHLRVDLKENSVSGGVLTFASQALSVLLNLGSLAVLGRMLAPASFGLLDMALVFAGFALPASDLGLSEATVQRSKIDQRSVSTLFWINLFIGCLFTLSLGFAAHEIAAFYDEPRLVPVIWVLSSTVLFSSCVIQHRALLTRQMQFRKLVIIDLTGQALGVAVAIVGAALGWSHWALVFMQVSTAITKAGLTVVFNRWLPSSPVVLFQPSDAWHMLRFGLKLAFFRLVNYFSRNADNAVIGRYTGQEALGLYRRAYQLLTLPLRQLNMPLGTVAVPALSMLQGNRERFAAYYYKAVRVVAYGTLTITTVLFAVAYDLLRVMLGAAWTPAAGLFSILAIGSFGEAISSSGGWLYMATGRTGAMLLFGLITTPIIVAGFIVGALLNGAEGVAWSYVVTSWCLRLPAIYFATRSTLVSVRGTLRAVVPATVFSLLTGGAAWTTTLAMQGFNPLLRLAAALMSAALVGVLLATTSPLKGDIVDAFGVIAPKLDKVRRLLEKRGKRR